MYLFDNKTLKWEDGDGNRYCMHVHQDEIPDDPRENCEPLTTMACWHRRRNLGDDIGNLEPDVFWQKLVEDNVPEEFITAAAIAGEIGSISVSANADDPKLYDIRIDGELHEENMGVPESYIPRYILNDLSIQDFQKLLHPYAEWLPIWGYEHGGIAISCGVRVYPFSDVWDSGQLGVIIALKDRILSEFPLDPNDDDTWRKKADEIMQTDVKEYNQYLTGEVYWIQIFKFVDDGTEDGGWDEIDGCSGFYGDDPVENGIVDAAGYGLKEALESGTVEEGTAQQHTTVTWVY